MVKPLTVQPGDKETRWQRAWAAAASVLDPEVPVLNIEDLGILREIHIEGEQVEAILTPTYSGCPAMNRISLDVALALEQAGFTQPKITLTLNPAWSTDWMSDAGRAKLLAYGVAPPKGKAKCRPLFSVEQITCPQCGSGETEQLAEFGSTACKALWRCLNCREPFDYFKCL